MPDWNRRSTRSTLSSYIHHVPSYRGSPDCRLMVEIPHKSVGMISIAITLISTQTTATIPV